MEHAAMTLQLVKPALDFLPEYKAALERGWFCGQRAGRRGCT
jgi:hypothetical protein